MADIILKDESYEIIGACMEVHNFLGFGFKEVIYKDALEYEFQIRGISYQREKLFRIKYKDRVLSRKYSADFTVYESIVLEVKAKSQS